MENELRKESGMYDPDVHKALKIEILNHAFQHYIYEYYGLEFDETDEELERVYWDNVSVKKPTENIEKLLKYLNKTGIRTAVISNISYSGKILKEYIDKYIPGNYFEFILASSEYVFRKPHNRLFELALRKAGLEPTDVWYCGDNTYCDLEGASQSHIYPVWYKGAIEPESFPAPFVDCLAVNDWKELIELFENQKE
jgi:putative hydrolase of the HAD superfamily